MKTCGPSNKPPDLHKYKHTPTQNSQKDCKTEKSRTMDYSIFYTAAFLKYHICKSLQSVMLMY